MVDRESRMMDSSEHWVDLPHTLPYPVDLYESQRRFILLLGLYVLHYTQFFATHAYIHNAYLTARLLSSSSSGR